VKQLAGEFREFLRYLNEEEVEFLVIGGYAVSLYGFTRFTADMDLWPSWPPHSREKKYRPESMMPAQISGKVRLSVSTVRCAVSR
jgi:hypothetical protein